MGGAFHWDAMDTLHAYFWHRVEFDPKWGHKSEGMGAKWPKRGPENDYFAFWPLRAPGAAGGPLFPSHVTLQRSGWVGPIFTSSFGVAAKSAFSDRPHTHRDRKKKKKGQKGPFGATHGKNGTDGLEATEICFVLPVGVFWIDS